MAAFQRNRGKPHRFRQRLRENDRMFVRQRGGVDCSGCFKGESDWIAKDRWVINN